MQKVRIVTSSPEQAESVAGQFRLRGYEVEITAPGESSDSEPTILVNLETCDREHVFQRAAELAEAEGADVYIAAGCFGGEKADAAIEAPPSEQPSMVDAVNGVAAGLQNKRDLLAKALRQQRVLMREARAAERNRREQEAALRAAEQEARDGLAREAESLRMAEEQQRILRQEQEEAACIRVSQQEQNYLARMTAAFDHMQEQREDSDPGAAQVCVSEEPVQKRAAVMSRRGREWRAAVIASGILASVLMVGWSTVTQGPVPFPAAMVNRGHILEQQVPFGPAKVSPVPDVTPGPASRFSPKKPSALPQSDRSNHRTHPKTQPKNARRQSKNPRPTRYSNQRPRPAAQDDVAQDEIRDLRSVSQAPVARPESPQDASLKRYSDIK